MISASALAWTLLVALTPQAPSQDLASIPSMERAVAANGSDPAVLRALAAAYASVDDPRTEATFQRALRASQGNSALQVDHAEYLWRKHRDEAGNAEMERVLARSPADAELRGRYGEMLMQQNRFVQAAAELSRACASGTCAAERLGLWASALLETGRFPESARIWSRAIAAAPDQAEPHAGLGRLRLLQGDAAGAREELAIAAKRDPANASLRVDYGRALEAARAGDPTAAEAEYREALRLDPSFSAAHYSLGTLLARLGRADEAKAEIAQYQAAFEASQAARQRSGARRAQLSLGWTRLEAKDAEGAIAAFSGLGNDPEALRGSGEALLALGRRDEARDSFQRAAALAPSDPRIQWALARSRAEGDR